MFAKLNKVQFAIGQLALLVGSSGLEPPTLRLSGVRSNHLSYEPIKLHLISIKWTLPNQASLSLLFWLDGLVQFLNPWWRWGGSNSWPPACKAGALPAELHPHGAFFKAFSIVFSFSFVWKNVVGLTRLELVTSRLSGVRSNQLSYRPIFESYGSLKTEQYFEISDVRPTRS